MNESRWAVRKIRKGGRVKIGGKWYRPDPAFMKYDGRLDGLTYLFGRYISYREDSEKYQPYINCWGPAENSGKDPDEWVDDPQIVDGFFNWCMWYAEDYCFTCCNRRTILVDEDYSDYGLNGEQVQKYRTIEIDCPSCYKKDNS